MRYVEVQVHIHIITKGVVVALFVLDAPFPEPVDGIRVAHSHEWPLGLLELRVVLLDSLGSNGVLQSQVNNPADDMLKVAQEVVECDKIQLSLDVSVLGKLLIVSIQWSKLIGSRVWRHLHGGV